jgi:hypothetical protein
VLGLNPLKHSYRASDATADADQPLGSLNLFEFSPGPGETPDAFSHIPIPAEQIRWSRQKAIVWLH